MRSLSGILLKSFLFILAAIALYIAGILIINTILDVRPVDSPLTISGPSGFPFDTSKNVYSFVSWNIGYGGMGQEADFFYDGGSMVRPSPEYADACFNGIKNMIRSFNDPDILLLQEVDQHSKRSYYRNQYTEIAQILSDHSNVFAPNYDAFFVPLPLFNPMGKVLSGLATFSKYTLSDANMYAFSGNYSWPKKLFMPDRCFSVASFALPSGKKLHVLNIHNSAFDDGRLRREQVATIFRMMNDLYRHGDYVVAGGDWNVNPPGFNDEYFASGDPAFRVDLDDGVFDEYHGWQFAYDPAIPTNRDVSSAYHRGSTPATIIDFFVCSPNIIILSINTLNSEFAHSDHQPVNVRFALDLAGSPISE